MPATEKVKKPRPGRSHEECRKQDMPQVTRDTVVSKVLSFLDRRAGFSSQMVFIASSSFSTCW